MTRHYRIFSSTCMISVFKFHLFCNVLGLVEFLLDRNIETLKECKEAKYEIVKILSASTVFDQSVLTAFQDFVKEGPFYVQAITEVAFENE